MEYRNLGRTGIKVSSLCLGTMTWGVQNTEAEAHEQLDYALERGINFIDTAEMYPVPPSEETYTLTEQYIGRWGKLKTDRDKVILATKVVGPTDFFGRNYIRSGVCKLDRENIEQAIDASLKRLNVDYIDLYQLHWPDRSTNYFGQLGYQHQEGKDGTPIQETLEVLNDLTKSGKVRAFGLSNETPWGTMRFLQEADSQGLPRMASIQNPYNLLNRSYEVGLAEISHREDIGLLAYSPLAFGALSGKYLQGAKPEGARMTRWEQFSRYTTEQAEVAISQYVDLAKKHELSPAQMALAYVTSRSFVSSNIIGATKMEQLKENIDSAELNLSDEVLAGIEEIHLANTNPCP